MGVKAMNDWPFADPENVATFTLRQIVRGGEPILLVFHSDEDGAWSFLTGDAFETKDTMIVGLFEIAARDASVKQLAGLPLGWRAWREHVKAPWQRAPK